MNPALSTWARVAFVLAFSAIGFVALQGPIRYWETIASAKLLHLFGADRAHVVLPTSIQVFPTNGDAFRAVVTPSCSSAASVVALSLLSTLVPKLCRRRLGPALLVAVFVIVVGNIVRIAGSVAVGFVAGRPSLVLFHDWVGSIFTFVYILAGFVMMLYLLLPRHATT